MIPALIPTLVAESNRHKRPWKDSSRTPMVPLVDVKGQEFEGRIIVPLSLCFTQEHTNERLKFNALIQENLDRWAEWRSRRGWEMSSKPKIKGPYFPAGGDSERQSEHFARAKRIIGEGKDIHEVTNFDEPEEVRWYFVTATFKRTTPQYVKLEDALYLNHLNDIYSTPEPKDSGWVNPLVFAEQRRQRLGLRRKDYLLGRLQDPL